MPEGKTTTISRAIAAGWRRWLRLPAMVLAGVACLAATAPARADDKPVQLKLSHWLPPSHPLQASIQEWIDSIKKDSNGTVTGIIFPAE